MSSLPLIPLKFTKTLKTRLLEPKPLMQFVLGPRQVGKTTGIQMLIAQLPFPIHYVLAEEELNPAASWLKKQWFTALSKGNESVLIIDEIQKIAHWPQTLKFLWDYTLKEKRHLRCVFLGSSSLDLFHEMESALMGRFEVLFVPHWDFQLSKKLIPSFTFDQHLRFGGYPGTYRFLNTPTRWRKYLRHSILEAVLTRDLLRIKRIQKESLLRELLILLASYPAQVVSYTKLLGQLQDSGNVEWIQNYFTLLKKTFLFQFLEKFSSKKIVQKKSSPKIIPLCAALTEALAPEVTEERRFEAEVGRILLQLGGAVFYWKERNFEVDFIYKNKKGALFAIEAKSGKKRNTRSLEAFIKKVPHVTPLIVGQENLFSLKHILE